MDKIQKAVFSNLINTIIKNNNKVIQAIDAGKKINTEKAIKACMKSNNETLLIIKDFIVNFHDDNSNSSEKYADAMKYFLKKFEK